MTTRMTVAEEAHWRYQLEQHTNWGYNSRRGLVAVNTYGLTTPPEVVWLREEARYKCHLADAQARRAAAVHG